MTRSGALVTTSLALSLALACAHQRAFTPDDRRQIEAVLEQQRQAWNRGDLPGYMAGYARSEQLVFTSGAKIRRGWEATLAAYQKRYGADRARYGPAGLRGA